MTLQSPLVIEFGAWMPDLPEWRNPGAIEAKNVIPLKAHYGPFQGLSLFSSALATGRAMGAIASVKSDGTIYDYVATATKLYQLAGTGWTDVTRLVGGNYTVDDRVEFMQWGETVISVNGHTDNPQSITLGGANFADLAGSPPQAKHLCSVQNFVVMANTDDSIDGARSQRVWWSGINNAGYWTPDLARQCSYRDLGGSSGMIQRIIGGEFGVILRDRSIWRMSYIGPPGIFQFDEVDEQHGTTAPWSAIKYGRIVYFLSDDGFYAFDGSQTIPLGRHKVDEWFIDDYDPTKAYMVTSEVDLDHKLIYTAYPSKSAGGDICDRIMIFNPATGEFSRAEIDTELLCQMYAQTAQNMDNVDAIYPAGMDAVAGSLDDLAFAGGLLTTGAFTTDHKLAFFTGSNLAATIDTNEKQVFSPRRGIITAARPLVDASGMTVTPITRETVADTPTPETAEAVDADTGEAYPISNARYHRFRVDVPSATSWTKASGVEITNGRAEGRV